MFKLNAATRNKKAIDFIALSLICSSSRLNQFKLGFLILNEGFPSNRSQLPCQSEQRCSNNAITPVGIEGKPSHRQPMFPFGIASCQIRDSLNVARYEQRLIVRSLDARIFNYEFHEKAELLSKSSFTIVTTPDGVEQALGAISGHPVLGADTETTGLDPLRSRVRLLQIATPDQSFVFDLFQVAAFDHPAL